MTPFRCAILLLAASLNTTFAAVPDIDASLATLAQEVGKEIKKHQKKKVAVADFHDFQGTTQGELGKYIAEQVTVNLVMEKRDFSVLDRANLKRILAEHKLTSQGLIDPENAKKLGMFAGVDALVLGTIIPKGSNSVSLNAKIITTDIAEILAAARTEFVTDELVQQLVSKASSSDAGGPIAFDGSQPVKPRAPEKPFGELQAKVESFRFTSQGGFGLTTLRFVITNTSSTVTYGVAYPGNAYRDLKLSNARGEEFTGNEIQGIEAGGIFGGRIEGDFTDIPPKSAITIRAVNQNATSPRPGDYRPYTFEMVIVFAEENQGRYSNPRKHILTFEVK